MSKNTDETALIDDSSNVELSSNDFELTSSVKVEQEKLANRLLALPYHTKLTPPAKVIFKSNKPSMVQENPYSARSPQEIMQLYGNQLKDESMFPNNPAVPQYIDSFDVGDFQSQLETVNKVTEQFNALPSEVRARFNNDFREFGLAISKPDFNIESIMTDSYRDNVYKPLKRKKQLKADYEAYLEQEAYEKLHGSDTNQDKPAE